MILLTRILKAKYFPRRDFFDATIGHNPSFTWRSIWSSQNLITLNYRWKIVDGSHINVWSSPWKQQFPPRIRSMLWCMAHSCLPTHS